jgi:hypothetical protein
MPEPLPLKATQWPNLVTFPRALRDAIPTEPTMVGRVLNLDVNAARQLAATLVEIAGRAEGLEPGSGW